jgi:hypothetical protein
MIGFIDTLFTQLWTTGNYSAIADLHNLQFTVTHALGFSIFIVVSWQRICNSLTVISNHSLTPFLPLFCNCQFRRPNTIPHISADWRPETRHFTSLYAAELFFITTFNGPRRKHSLSIFWKACYSAPLHINGSFRYRENVFTESLPSNERLF